MTDFRQGITPNGLLLAATGLAMGSLAAALWAVYRSPWALTGVAFVMAVLMGIAKSGSA